MLSKYNIEVTYLLQSSANTPYIYLITHSCYVGTINSRKRIWEKYRSQLWRIPPCWVFSSFAGIGKRIEYLKALVQLK